MTQVYTAAETFPQNRANGTLSQTFASFPSDIPSIIERQNR